MIRCFSVLACMLALLPFASESEERQPFVEVEGSKKYALIIVGAAVDDRRSQNFARWAFSLGELLQRDFGYAPERLRLLVGDSRGDSVDGSSRIESIRSQMADLAESIRPQDQLMVVLVGHGTGRGELAKFNIVGPDISGPEFAAMLDRVRTQNIVVINTTSASHDFSKALAANGRVVVSATRTAAERYDTVFPYYFVEALRNRAADRDKNGRISVLEAFNYAKAGVESYFKERGILPTEHAVLDDNGDGIFSPRADPGGDGNLAEIAYLDLPPVLGRDTNLAPAAAALWKQMNQLEREVIALRADKSALDEAVYWARLESLLIELAKVTREYDGLSQ